MPNRIIFRRFIDARKQTTPGKIAAYQATAPTVHGGGYEEASWVDGTNTIVNTTYLSPIKAFRQAGRLLQVKVKTGTATWTNVNLKLKVFRRNGTTSQWDLVGQEAFVVTAGIKETVTLTFTTTINVQIGDVPGMWCDGAQRSSGTGGPVFTEAGDINGSAAFATQVAAKTINNDYLMAGPYLAVTGDSIPEGHCASDGNDNHGGMHTTGWDGITSFSVPWPIPTAEIMAQLKLRIGNGTVLKYQNLALGSQAFSWVASTGIVKALEVKPHTVIIHCGIYDVVAPRTWAAVEADLGTILAAVNAASQKPRLFIDEIMPRTDANDTNAVTIRTWNGNFATWCAANGATLIRLHDEMGQIRVSTGLYDDLLTAYNHDNTHPNEAGVAKLAEIWRRYI